MTTAVMADNRASCILIPISLRQVSVARLRGRGEKGGFRFPSFFHELKNFAFLLKVYLSFILSKVINIEKNSSQEYNY